jgi:hypothetical protein
MAASIDSAPPTLVAASVDSASPDFQDNRLRSHRRDAGTRDRHAQCSHYAHVVRSLGEERESIIVGVQIRQAET